MGGDKGGRFEAREASISRVLAATNRDLEQEIRKGTFREDLYHRLNRVVNILRRRCASAATTWWLLARFLLQKYAVELGAR